MSEYEKGGNNNCSICGAPTYAECGHFRVIRELAKAGKTADSLKGMDDSTVKLIFGDAGVELKATLKGMEGWETVTEKFRQAVASKKREKNGPIECKYRVGGKVMAPGPDGSIVEAVIREADSGVYLMEIETKDGYSGGVVTEDEIRG